MPIEIRELVIRTTVRDESTPPQATTETSQASKEAIIAECVDKVMEILKEKQER